MKNSALHDAVEVHPHPSTLAIPVAAISAAPAPVGLPPPAASPPRPSSTPEWPLSQRERPSQNLTPKQEAFCTAYLESGNASEAYRRSYDASNMSPSSVNRAAKELLDNPKIAARVSQLREPVIERMRVTLEGHLSDLLQLRERAIADGKWAAAIQAEIARGKVAGLYVQKIENYSAESSASTEEIDEKIRKLLDKYQISL